MVQRLEEGNLDEHAGLDRIADQFELSSRQVRRIIRAELGVPPIQLLLTRRLLLAKLPLIPIHFESTIWAFRSGLTYEGRADQSESSVKQAGEKAKDAVDDVKDAFKK